MSLRYSLMKVCTLLCCFCVCGPAAELKILPEYLRTAPDGSVVLADRAAAGNPPLSALTAARGGYVSLQVLAMLRSPGEYNLEMTPPTGLQVDVFREWYHALEDNKGFY